VTLPSDADEPHWAWQVEVPAPVIAQRRGEPVLRDGLEYLVGTLWLLIDGVRQGRVTYEVHDSLAMVQETPMWTMQEDDGPGASVGNMDGRDRPAAPVRRVMGALGRAG